MNRLILIGLISLSIVVIAQAQNSFEKGNILFNSSLGIGSNYAVQGSFHPSILLSADIGVHNYLSIGPYLGFGFFGNEQRAVDVGARLNFHWWQLLDDRIRADLKQRQIDLYWTLSLGYEFLHYQQGDVIQNQGRLDLGATTGIRWYPKGNRRFALFGELGYTPISYAVIGASIKLRN